MSRVQRVVLENDLVRVLEIRVPPGVAEAAHSHERGVTVALSDYDNETKTVPGGAVTRRHTSFGEVKWADPVTHEARNTGATEQHVIRIELKTGARASTPTVADPLDALVVCKDTQRLIFENADVRAIEDRGPAGNSTAKHTHQRLSLIHI